MYKIDDTFLGDMTIPIDNCVFVYYYTLYSFGDRNKMCFCIYNVVNEKPRLLIVRGL